MKNNEGSAVSRCIRIGDDLIKESTLLQILDDFTQLAKEDHVRKIEEGLKKNGSKRGRPKISEQLQIDIKKLRDEGLSKEAIARRLKISSRTVRKYLKESDKEK